MFTSLPITALQRTTALHSHCTALHSHCHCTALHCHYTALHCHCTALHCHCTALHCHCTSNAVTQHRQNTAINSLFTLYCIVLHFHCNPYCDICSVHRPLPGDYRGQCSAVSPPLQSVLVYVQTKQCTLHSAVHLGTSENSSLPLLYSL